MRLFALLFATVVVVASCNSPTDIPRPGPMDPVANWVAYCGQRTDCGLCASQSNCGFCPTTNQCVYYSMRDQSAKTSCPTLVIQSEFCK